MELLPTQGSGGIAGAAELKKKSPAADTSTLAAKKVAREFEALMVNEMLKSMRVTTGKDSLLTGGRGEEIFRSLLDQEYAQAIASQGTLGMAKIIEQQLVKHEPAPAAQPSTERRE
jgi:flagellar protein FlgJ